MIIPVCCGYSDTFRNWQASLKGTVTVGDCNSVTAVTITTYLCVYLSSFLPVQNAEAKVEDEEDQDLVPDELVDAALPPQQEVPNAVEPARGVLVDVGVDTRL